jgi:quercetin 2,3-dioxygenase
MTGSPGRPRVEVRRAGDRFKTRLAWLDSNHSFSFGNHWDPANTHFGLLLVSNDDIVKPGSGFETHPHRDMEIVTWVLQGSLVHLDSEGNRGIIYPGLAQRMSAGTGILHSEKNDSWKLAGGPTDLEGTGRLEEGDAVRITSAEGEFVTASGEAEVLVWEMHSSVEEQEPAA